MAESFSVKAILSAADSGFSRAFRSAESVVDSLSSKISSGLGFGILTGIGQQAFQVVNNGISDMVGELNSSSKAWKTFEGNMGMLGKGSGEIKQIKGELQDFATATIYSASDMATTYSQLAAVGTKNCTELVKGFGGLAAAAESPTQAMKTLSQQATQMAAKPKVAWEDFKLILEQTPAGIAAVAKEMGKSTSQLVKDVQAGTIETDAFFDAIARVGTNDAFTKLATSYKSVDEAMGGLMETVSNKLQPAFDKLSELSIGSIEKVIDCISEFDGEALAASITVDKLKTSMVSFGTVAGSAIMAIGGIKAFDTLSAGAESFGLSFDSVMGGVQTVTRKTSSVISSVGKALNSVNFDTLSKGAEKSIKKVSRTFKNAGSFIDGYGEKLGDALTAISAKFSDSGTMVKEKFAQTGKEVSKLGKHVTRTLLKSGKSVQNFADRVSTIVAPFEGVFNTIASSIGSGLQMAANVGMNTMNGMITGLTSVMNIAMSSLGPAAILGLVLAGLGLVNRQFSSQIDTMVQTAIGKGPQIIEGLISSILSRLPALMSAGAQLLTGFMQAVTVNLPAVVNGGVSIIHALVQGVIANLPMMMPAAIQLVATFADSILNALPQLLVTGMQFLDALLRGILTNADLIVDSASEIINGFMGNIQTKLPQILTLGMGILENLAQGAVRILPQLTVVGLNAITAFIQ